MDAARAMMIVGATLLPTLATGCATIAHGPTQSIPVSSDQPGACVVVDGTREYALPAVLPLKRGRDHTIVVTADGYQEQTRYFARKTSRAFWGNIWLGGLVGMSVDLATGACYELVPDQVHVTLGRVEEEKPAAVSMRPEQQALDDPTRLSRGAVIP